MIDKPRQGAEIDAWQRDRGVVWIEGWDEGSDVKTNWKLCVTTEYSAEGGASCGYIEGSTKKKSYNSDRWTTRHFMIRLNVEQINTMIEGLEILKGQED